MSNKFNLLALISLYLAGTNVVYALSCKNGDSSCSSQSAADCTNLGYSADNVKNCKHYLYCPFNTSYKTCVAFDNSEPEPDCSDYPLTECPEHGDCDECPDDNSYKKLTGCKTGYELNTAGDACIATPCPTVEFEIDTSSSTSVTIKVKSTTSNDVNKCGSKAEKGWEMYNTNTYSGNSLCYACKPRSCPDGYTTEMTSYTDCNGLFYAASTSSGETTCGKCVLPSSCEQMGYKSSTGMYPYNPYQDSDVGYLCKSKQVDLKNAPSSTCYYDCVACEDAVTNYSMALTSVADCRSLCRTDIEHQNGITSYNRSVTKGLSDTDGRRGACYTWSRSYRCDKYSDCVCQGVNEISCY